VPTSGRQSVDARDKAYASCKQCVDGVEHDDEDEQPPTFATHDTQSRALKLFGVRIELRPREHVGRCITV
jgi:hypothetical protein